MERLYYQVPYVATFTGTVVSCLENKNKNFEVELDRTAFYPEGGGQPSDRGMLNEIQVLGVHEKNQTVIHELNQPLEIGKSVTGLLDWDYRYENMQQHSGEHLISGLIHKHYGFNNVGFHMGKEEITIDMDGVMTPEQLERIELEANQMIYQNIPIEELYPDTQELAKLEYRSKKELSGQVRIIRILEGDTCACCGTHVRRTGEIGLIKIVGMIHYKGGIRVSLLSGKKALLDYQVKQKQIIRLSNLFSAKPETVAEVVEKWKQEAGQKNMLLNLAYEELYEAKAQLLLACEEPLLLFEPELSPTQLRLYCTRLYESKKGNPVILCSGRAEEYRYAIGSSSIDMKQVSQALNQALNGKGGGSKLLAQGTFQATQEAITICVREMADTIKNMKQKEKNDGAK